jgi:hypothetical protein
MKVDHVSYGRTFNLGNYESERFDISIEIGEEEQDLISLVFSKLRQEVLDAHKASVESRKAEVDKK